MNGQVHDATGVCDTVTMSMFIFPATVIRLIKIITLLVHFLFLFILLLLFASMILIFLLFFLVSRGVLIYRDKPIIVSSNCPCWEAFWAPGLGSAPTTSPFLAVCSSSGCLCCCSSSTTRFICSSSAWLEEGLPLREPPVRRLLLPTESSS